MCSSLYLAYKIASRSLLQACTINVFLVPLCLLQLYQPERGSGSSLKPSSCCLRQSQTVDLTLYGVSEHMQRRGIEHDRWKYESTAGLWKIVMEEATKGDPTSLHTPSTVSVQPIYRVRFQWQGKESVCIRIHLCLCAMSVTASWILVCLCATVRSKSGGASFPPALISLRVQRPTCFWLLWTGLSEHVWKYTRMQCCVDVTANKQQHICGKCLPMHWMCKDHKLRL